MTQSSVPVKLVQDTVPSLRKKGERYVFSKPALDFLRAYASCMDENQAMKEAQIDQRRLSEFLANPHIAAEMERIQEVYSYQFRMTANYAAGKHLQLMDKVEKEFDDAPSRGDRAKFAGTLAKMSETNLKATGLIGNTPAIDMPTVILNFSTGAPAPATPIDVTPTEGAQDA